MTGDPTAPRADDEQDLLVDALLAPGDVRGRVPPPRPIPAPGRVETENEALRRSLVALARHSHQSDPGHEEGGFEVCGHPMCRDVRALLPAAAAAGVSPEAPEAPTSAIVDRPTAEAPPAVPPPPSPPTSPAYPTPGADDDLLDALDEEQPIPPQERALPGDVDAFTPPTEVASPASPDEVWGVAPRSPEPEEEAAAAPETAGRAPASRGFADTAADAIDRVARSLFGGRRRR